MMWDNKVASLVLYRKHNFFSIREALLAAIRGFVFILGFDILVINKAYGRPDYRQPHIKVLLTENGIR